MNEASKNIAIYANDIAENIAVRIKEERKIQRLSQEKLAQLLGTTQCEISKLENGKEGSGILNLAKIIDVAKCLRCSWEYLVTGKDNKNMSNNDKIQFNPVFLDSLSQSSVLFKAVSGIEGDISSNLVNGINNWRYRVEYCDLGNDYYLCVSTQVKYSGYEKDSCLHYMYDKTFENESDAYTVNHGDKEDITIYPIMLEVNTYVICKTELIASARFYAFDNCRTMDTRTSNKPGFLSPVFKEIGEYLDSEDIEYFIPFHYVWGAISRWMIKDKALMKLLDGTFAGSEYPLVIVAEAFVRKDYRNNGIYSIMRKAAAISMSEDFVIDPIPSNWIEIAPLFNFFGDASDTDENYIQNMINGKYDADIKRNKKIAEHYGMTEYKGSREFEEDSLMTGYYYRIPKDVLDASTVAHSDGFCKD